MSVPDPGNIRTRTENEVSCPRKYRKCSGINLRGVSAAALGRRVSYFAFDSAADAANAIKLLKKALK